MSNSAPSKRKRGGCPLCGAPVTPDHAPFCSQGCRDRDLLNWLGDAYRTPGPPADEEGRENANDGLDTP
uniref:DNA gyrase inhibitor YacG n=1 Tax=Edaphosphingomonas laterariae TaxID=861865 RepID=UPI000B783974|nr:DNA gyrase inhibitor YacG [Sphingomonas laterariae]